MGVSQRFRALRQKTAWCHQSASLRLGRRAEGGGQPGLQGLWDSDQRPGGWVRAGPGLCLLAQGPLREGAGSPPLGGTAATSLVLCR